MAADAGDTALARRRVGEARNGANPAQQQAIGVLLARLELAEGRPQAALDLLRALPQSLPEQAQRDAAAVRGQALFRVGRPVDAVRALVEREVWLGDGASILANQRMIWDGFRDRRGRCASPTTGDPVDRRLARVRAVRKKRRHGLAPLAALLAANVSDASRGRGPAC